MDKRIYISVYKQEDEAVKTINKLNAQGFRPDQISVVAYNTERFSTLFKPEVTQAALPEDVQAKTDGDLPREAEKMLAPDIVVSVAGVPGTVPQQHPVPAAAYIPMTGLTGLKLKKEHLLAHERSLQEGDILVILQTDEGQAYRPDLPLIK